MPVLAINGGSPVGSPPFPAWPIHDQREVEAVVDVVKSGRWGGNYLAEPGYKADEVAARFAAVHDARDRLPAMNGTVTLEGALRAARRGPRDPGIVPPTTPVAP